jgi:hypothetical protein
MHLGSESDENNEINHIMSAKTYNESRSKADHSMSSLVSFFWSSERVLRLTAAPSLVNQPTYTDWE